MVIPLENARLGSTIDQIRGVVIAFEHFNARTTFWDLHFWEWGFFIVRLLHVVDVPRGQDTLRVGVHVRQWSCSIVVGRAVPVVLREIVISVV